MSPEFHAIDAWEAQRAVRARELSATELVDAAFVSLAAHGEAINAFTVLFEDSAWKQAAEVDAALLRGEDPGPLAGIPVSIKDAIWMSGAPATNGSRAFQGFVAPQDCAAVRRIRDSGAIIVGKTNNPEFCYAGYTDNFLFGPTRNPWDPSRTAGGSSGGAAASVAVGITPLAIGSDSGGSIRLPASFCGVVGLKPTFGLVPKEPGFAGSKTLSANGPITRTARDAAMLLAVMAGPDTADDLSFPSPNTDYLAAVQQLDLSELSVAYSTDCGFAPLEPELRELFLASVDVFASTGAAMAEAHPNAGDPTGVWTRIATAETFASEGPLLERWEHQMWPGVPDLIRVGNRSAADFITALHERARYTQAWEEFFGAFDLLLVPSAQVPPFEVGTEGPTQIAGKPIDPPWGDWCGLCYIANLTGQPAVTVPCGFDSAGMPVGLQVIGPRWADARVLRAAAAWESVRPKQAPFRATV